MVGVSLNECPSGRFRLRRDNDPSRVLSVRKEPQLSLPPAVSGEKPCLWELGKDNVSLVYSRYLLRYIGPQFGEIFLSCFWGEH